MAKKRRVAELTATAQDMIDRLHQSTNSEMPTKALEKLAEFGYTPEKIKKLEKEIPGASVVSFHIQNQELFFDKTSRFLP